MDDSEALGAESTSPVASRVFLVLTYPSCNPYNIAFESVDQAKVMIETFHEGSMVEWQEDFDTTSGDNLLVFSPLIDGRALPYRIIEVFFVKNEPT